MTTNPSADQALPTPTMTLDQARQVMYFKNYYRPMGELFDAGYLDSKRLQWAADNAYVPQIKEAARVLLNSPRSKPPAITEAITIDISEDDARKVEWPFSTYKGKTFGELLDAGQLSLKDLGYAIEMAFSEKVRKAACFFSLLRLRQQLEKPIATAGPLKVSGRAAYLEKQRERTSFKQGVFIAAVLCFICAVLIVDLWKFILPLHLNNLVPIFRSWIGWLVLAIVSGLGYGLYRSITHFVNKKFDSWDTEIKNNRKGQEGEDCVVDAMRESLDSHWHLFRNVVLPGSKQSDIDGVLVGPYGVWAFEVKTYSGEIRNVKGEWDRKCGNLWKKLESNPGGQARSNAARLSEFLAAEFNAFQLKKWVMPVIIMANPEMKLTLHSPETQVWCLDRFGDELGNLYGTVVPEDAQMAIKAKLLKLCV